MRKKTKEWCPEYITTSFVAKHCGVSNVTVLGWIEEKRLPAFRLPKGHFRIYRDDFLEFMEKHKIPIHQKHKD